MLIIKRKIISYRSADSGREVRHHVLIACIGEKNILLSHSNLFIYEHALSSIETSNRYSNVISMFYRFLATEKRFADVDVADYHVLANNIYIKRWQVARQVTRVKSQKDSPSSATIFEDAKILLVFFKWVRESGYITNVNVLTKNWMANFKSNRMLNYVRRKAYVNIDAKNIEVLDKENRQKKLKSLITNDEIRELIEAYTDPVYATMFKLGLGTAMRPMDLCKFPYIGNGRNKHIMPFAEMAKTESAKVFYQVKDSKGKKTRTIVINRADLKMIEEQYIRPYYAERVKKYEERFGEKCPLSILFLNSRGRPVTPGMVASRTNDAKKLAMANHPDFRERVTFYDARHWWPTMFLIKFFGDKLLTQAADALYLAAAEVLTSQMGHDDISTTFRYYVDMARLLLLAHKGLVHELITEDGETVEEFVDRIDG